MGGEICPRYGKLAESNIHVHAGERGCAAAYKNATNDVKEVNVIAVPLSFVIDEELDVTFHQIKLQ